MDFILTITALLITLILISRLINSLSGRNKRNPPGPRRLPIIGNLHLLGDQPRVSLSRLAKTYGPIMLLRFGFKNVVVFSSAAMAKQVLQKQDLAFSSRAIMDSFGSQKPENSSLGLLPVGPLWRTLRKIMSCNVFSTSCLDESQHVRRQKVVELVEYCRKSSGSGEAVDLGRAAFRTSLNLLSNTIFSKDLEDPLSDSGKELKELIAKIMVEVVKPNLVDFFPFLRALDPQGIRGRMSKYSRRINELINVQIDERVELRNSKNKDENLIDILLTICEKKTENIDRTHIVAMCLDLIIAGTDTTASTLEWAMTEALRNPETIKRVKHELGQVVGKGNIINEEDLKRLPYLQCMVKESMRLHSPVPFLVPRKVEQDVEVCGYTVPKNSLVFVNAWAIGRDGDTWVDPLEFKPERFLDSDVDVMGRDFEFIPFGSGRRICPGLPLAMRVVPVMLGSLLNSFDWKLEGGISPENLNMEERFGLTLQKAHPLRAIPIPL